MPVTVWPVDPGSRRTLPPHQYAGAARIQTDRRGELVLLGPDPLDSRPEQPSTGSQPEEPLATYHKGAWYRAVVTDADGEVVAELGVSSEEPSG